MRPLLGEPGSAAEVTRDYRLAWDDAGPPLLSVLGGKLTTYRKLAEEAVDHLMPRLARRATAWTAGAPLPGGEIPGQDLAAWRESLARSRPWLRADLRDRWACAYGSRVERLLEGAFGAVDLGAELAPGLCERELAYLAEVEFARSAADVLWRRTKLGLRLPPSAGEAVDDWLRHNYPSRSSEGLTERDGN